MNTPHNIFSFEVQLTLYVFVAYGEFSVPEFIDFADNHSLVCIPDKVILVYQDNIISLDQLEAISRHLKARFHCNPETLRFNEHGLFEVEGSEVENFLECGRKQIIKLRKPVLAPPPGKAFVKPSGARESFFIQASNLFIRHAEMSFLALLLIREWGDRFNADIKTIFVDTIDLYGLTSLACRMRLGDNRHGPITVSFSSYTAYKEVLKHANVSTSLMVISATTTHKLLRKITEDTRWKDISKVVTILDLDSASYDGGPQVVSPKVMIHVERPNEEIHLKLLPSIRLAGEKFTVEVDEPKSVVLNCTAHHTCLEYLHLDRLAEMGQVLSTYIKHETSRLPVAIDVEKLIQSQSFIEWLQNEVAKHAPITTRHVVCMDNVTQLVKSVLSEFNLPEGAFLSPEELRNPTVSITGSAIVICPTFSTGAKLLEVSRDLRKHRSLKNIVYFTGIGTPESLFAAKKLKANLEANGYKLVSFCNICTGAQESLTLSWQTEQDLLRNNDSLNAIPELQARAQMLENGRLDNGNLFYRMRDLELHPGFRYWENIEYDPAQPNAVLLFTTFAFLLQDARTNSALPEKDRLTPLPNRRVLLDPENFFRYNDSLIQVAFLRAAFPSEIDFSDHEAHSASVVYLLRRAENVKCRALVYELLMALASRRLQITREKFNAVRKLLANSTLEECKWFAATDYFKENIEYWEKESSSKKSSL